MADWRFALSDLDFGEAEDAAVSRVMSSRWLSMGPEVAAFEEEFAAMVGVRHAVAVSSATAALHLSLLGAGVDGGEVVQPALNFVASANMTRATGARPVFTDIPSLNDPTITAEIVEPLLTAETRAVIAMHYGGTPCRMEPLLDLCRARRIPLIEDACHAVGARYGAAAPTQPDAMAGSLADIACFSFFSNKNLATGEGGMVTTNDDEIASRLRLLRSHGMTTLTWDRHSGHARSYDVVESGFNYRLDELHAAIGRAQLAGLDSRNRRRLQALRRYHERLRDIDGWILPFADDDRPTSGHLMVAVAASRHERDVVADGLRDRRIQTSLHYPAITGFSAFAGHGPTPAVTAEFVSRAVTLPLHARVSLADVDEICAAVLDTVSNAASRTRRSPQ